MTRAAALAGIVSISWSAIFMRFAAASPATAAFWRGVYGLPVLVVAWWLVGRRGRRSAASRAVAFAAGLALALDLVIWQMSIDRIGASLSVVLANLQVVFVGAVAWALHREKPTATALAVVPVVIVGVALISGLGRSDAYGADPVGGTLLGVSTALTYTLYLVVFRQANRMDPAPAPGPMLDATLGLVAGSVVFALFEANFALAPSWPAHGWFLGLGVLVQGAGWMLITVALPRLPALETSVMLLLQPTLAVIWARLIFAEALSPLQWAGVAVVLGGVVLLATRGMVEAPAVTPPSAAGSPGS
ncbi:MAG: DMT family transporter [Actinobacteria bacterium]|nr:DMT family transporter [Actinomycetota bacterium]